ncbi:MAG: hypothetical protein NZ483_00825 [Verrucomicrobiae bacterium]|nr:hypothetical protein [Verrucomicrobiae bacterium]MDW8342919.1 phosphopantothenoylcysteine decarboxylase [Verrucomicrobiae bacterium]
MKWLVTAGPTREHWDPVRFLSNRSSGRMGYAIGEAARAFGAVTLVSGPVALPVPAGVELVRVVSAAEMAEAVWSRFDEADVVVMAAAVCDFRPKQVATEKWKKDSAPRVIELEPTPDILAECGRRKRRQVLVGFAVETEQLEERAWEKLRRKNLDWIVANEATAFEAETNRVVLLGADGSREEFPELPKDELARRLVARWVRRS